MSDTPIYLAKGDSPEMIAAFKRAQETFKYFWRELSWEYRRIVPALDLACVKVAFSQEFPGQDSPVVEHMWINEIDFDGETISGVLINQPNELTNVNNGDAVTTGLSEISDWMFAMSGTTYGGFTIHAMRAMLPPAEREEHDEAWGLNFGDYNDILLVSNQKEHPENLVEHPMDKNMEEKLLEFLQQYPNELNGQDEYGYTMLHREAIAGNGRTVALLLKEGADKHKTTNSGKTALDFAKQMKWEYLVEALEK